MSELFFNLKRSVLLLFMVLFTFTAVYVPQSHTPKAEAQPAQLGAQIQQFGQQLYDNILQTNILGVNIGKMTTMGLQWSVTSILNGIAWTAAKAAISMIQRSIVRWINSGFQGSPAFVQDLRGMLTNFADEAMGQFLQELGGPFSMVCSPFRLDVQIAISLAYNRSRDKNARRCTLSGAMQNIRNFSTDMRQGGWNSWFQISQNSGQYTQYGSGLEASVEAGIRITNAQGQQMNLLNWGRGFMSSKVCRPVANPVAGEANEKCYTSTPGSVIADQLNHTLGLGSDTLVTADQINEIIGALMQQLVTQVITGASGLLGAGGGQGSNSQYTNPTFNVDLYTPGMEIRSSVNNRELLVDALATEQQYLELAKAIVLKYDTSYTTDPDVQRKADAAYNEARAAIPQIDRNIAELEAILAKYDAALQEVVLAQSRNEAYDISANESKKAQIMNEYAALGTNLHIGEEVRTKGEQWNTSVGGLITRAVSTVDRTTLTDAITLENKYLALTQSVVKLCKAKTSLTTTESDACDEAAVTSLDTQDRIITIQNLLIKYNSSGDNVTRKEVEDAYTDLKNDLSTEASIERSQLNFELIFGTLP